ncbi:MAG TPA: hypothetical protein VF585_05370 [Chthoniobacterales bacterium]
MAVILAIPGSGKPGIGFTVISATFLIGNVGSLIYGLLSCRHAQRRRRIIGILVQIATVPVCFCTAILLLYIFNEGQL